MHEVKIKDNVLSPWVQHKLAFLRSIFGNIFIIYFFLYQQEISLLQNICVSLGMAWMFDPNSVKQISADLKNLTEVQIQYTKGSLPHSFIPPASCCFSLQWPQTLPWQTCRRKALWHISLVTHHAAGRLVIHLSVSRWHDFKHFGHHFEEKLPKNYDLKSPDCQRYFGN